MDAELLTLIKKYVRSGKFLQARGRIKSIQIADLTREQRLELAFLSNAAGFPANALRLLQKFVRPEVTPREGPAAADEVVEYGRALVNLGAVDEAIELLAPLSTRALPRVHRYLALAYFQKWDWEAAIPLLHRAIKVSSSTLNDRLYAQVFLAAALLHGRKDFDQARMLLHRALSEAEAKRFYVFRWDAAQLLAQCAYLQKDWKEALRYLELAKAYYAGGLDQVPGLVIESFQALIDLHFSARRESGLRRLDAVHDRFLALNAWARARSCDYYRALALKDQALAVHLYYGTDLPKFRERLLDDFGWSEKRIPDVYALKLGAGSRGRGGWIEVRDAKNSFGKGTLRAGDLPQRLLRSLCSDFYRRFTVMEIHALLHPREFYDPSSSPDRVRHTLGRLRRFLDRQRIPLGVVLKRGRWSLHARGPIELRIHRHDDSQLSRDTLRARHLVVQVRDRFGLGRFRASDVEKILGVSRATAVAALQDAIDGGLIRKENGGPQTRYRIADPKA